jgi:thiol-disulfide isomerase/thioredoxin
MKRRFCCLIGVFLCFFLCSNYAAADNALPGKGSVLPEIRLAVPKIEAHRTYLGISGGESFTIPDIKADVVIIEIFSMYCPHCQREAPSVNELYRIIENNPHTQGKVKLIGIGVGNDTFEVEFFKNKYDIPFPLFDDDDYVIHEQLGKPNTPFFIAVRIKGGGADEVSYTQLGGFERADEFLDLILRESGLKGGEQR